MQSYQNVSNSQLYYLANKYKISCKRFCKVIKMLAIHNTLSNANTIEKVANAFAKLSKCQQFTTENVLHAFQKMLQTLLQSYQNVSNSQPSCTTGTISLRCKRFCKVIKMLAIHNLLQFVTMKWIVANAFAKLSKCQQFTTSLRRKLLVSQLQTLLQSYQNVSNSQLLYFQIFTNYCCKRFCKVIKMLAIHNFSVFLLEH